jgi:glycosyltransferase involved in cell wall biosynthesis
VGAAPARAPVRVVRIIARLNIGGPAIQAITLTKVLGPRGYRTTLVRGSESPEEGTMDGLAAELGVRPVRVAALRRDPGAHDLVALAQVWLIIARERPRIVHTHAAKGGTIGRAAALLQPPGRRPLLVHTYHGHSLRGYFSPGVERVYTAIERFLAGRTDRLIAVSEEVRDDLVRLGVAGAGRFDVVHLGFALEPFLAGEAERRTAGARVRGELGIPAQARVVTLVARLVAIKRVDRFLRVAARLAGDPETRFLIVGDGDLRAELEAAAAAAGLDGRLTWAGFRTDMASVCFASDVVVLTSDNEGTPVSLIEAQAAGRPVVSTRVGGVASVVDDGRTGLLAAVDDDEGLAAAVAGLLADPERAQRMGAAGRERVRSMFSLERLVNDVDRLYAGLLVERGSPARPA